MLHKKIEAARHGERGSSLGSLCEKTARVAAELEAEGFPRTVPAWLRQKRREMDAAAQREATGKLQQQELDHQVDKMMSAMYALL